MLRYSLLFVLCLISSAFGIEIQGCETQTINLTCPEGQVILVSNATYGPAPEGVCSTGRETNTTSDYCLTADNTKTLMYICGNQTTCPVSVTIQYFENPCPNNTKLLTVYYDCVNASEYEAEQPTEPPCPNIPSEGCSRCNPACERTCRNPSGVKWCPFQPLYCYRNCYCRRGLVRDETNGNCCRRGDCTSTRAPRFG